MFVLLWLVSYLQPQGTVGNHVFQKNKEQNLLTSSSVRGSLMYLSARWFEIAFITRRMIIGTVLLTIPNAFAVFLIRPSSERSYIVTATSISTKIGFQNLVVFLLKYWRSYLHIRQETITLKFGSFLSISLATTSSLANWSDHCFVRPGRIQYSRFFSFTLFLFFTNNFIAEGSELDACRFFSSRCYLKVYAVWLELNIRDFVNFFC